MSEVTLTGANFEAEVMKSTVPVLVDFWAEWCMPCKMIAPTLEQLAKDYAGKLKIGKVNIDSAPDLAEKYGVVSIPTLMVFKNGKMESQKVGAQPRPALEAMFKHLV